MLYGLIKRVKEYDKLLKKYEKLEKLYQDEQTYIDQCIDQMKEYESIMDTLGSRCEELEKELSTTKKSNVALKNHNLKYKEKIKTLEKK